MSKRALILALGWQIELLFPLSLLLHFLALNLYHHLQLVDFLDCYPMSMMSWVLHLIDWSEGLGTVCSSLPVDLTLLTPLAKYLIWIILQGRYRYPSQTIVILMVATSCWRCRIPSLESHWTPSSWINTCMVDQSYTRSLYIGMPKPWS